MQPTLRRSAGEERGAGPRAEAGTENRKCRTNSKVSYKNGNQSKSGRAVVSARGCDESSSVDQLRKIAVEIGADAGPAATMQVRAPSTGLDESPRS